MFLPGKPHKACIMPCAFTLKWFDKTSVKTLYPNTDFQNALSEKENPDRPDVIALAAYDGDEIAAPYDGDEIAALAVLRQTRTHCGRSALT